MIALIAVIEAQKMNGMVIRKSYDVSDHNTQLAVWRKTDHSSFDRSVQKSKFMHHWRACRTRLLNGMLPIHGLSHGKRVVRIGH
jgi:hypothetical protein